MLDRVEDVAYWGKLRILDTDEDMVRRSEKLLFEMDNPELKEWLIWRLDFRTLIAALRRRKEGEGVPGKRIRWGTGQLVMQIEKNWQHETFRLQAKYPWLAKADELLNSKQTFELEKLLLQQVWKYYDSQAAQKPFGIEEVFLYLVKWDLVNRWCSYSSLYAVERFHILVNKCLAETIDLKEIQL